jgi:20S proteasome alpha/beta subunit
MTCIAYKNGVIASDSRVTADSSIFTDKLEKIFRLKDGSLIGSAGDADDRTLRDLLNRLKGKDPTPKQIAALELLVDAIIVRPDGTITCISCDKEESKDRWKVSIFKMNDSFIAVGSGSQLAAGAMAHGASAAQAVKIAIKYDNTCGGKVQTLKLKEEA